MDKQEESSRICLMFFFWSEEKNIDMCNLHMYVRPGSMSFSLRSQQRQHRRWYSWYCVATSLIPHYLSNIASRQHHHLAPRVCFEEAVCWLQFLHVRTGSKCQRTSGPQSWLWSQHSSKHRRGAFQDASDKCLAACRSTRCEACLAFSLHKLVI